MEHLIRKQVAEFRRNTMAEKLAAKHAKQAKKATSKKESFTYSAPNAQSVQLAGSFTDWDKQPIAMRKQKDGTWKAEVALAPGEYEYRFLVDGEWRDDENCSLRRPNSFGGENCVREVK